MITLRESVIVSQRDVETVKFEICLKTGQFECWISHRLPRKPTCVAFHTHTRTDNAR